MAFYIGLSVRLRQLLWIGLAFALTAEKSVCKIPPCYIQKTFVSKKQEKKERIIIIPQHDIKKSYIFIDPPLLQQKWSIIIIIIINTIITYFTTTVIIITINYYFVTYFLPCSLLQKYKKMIAHHFCCRICTCR